MTHAFRRIVDDLLVLEVNLVVVDGELATQHPTVRASLAELARAYEATVGGPVDRGAVRTVSAEVFDEISRRAAALRAQVPGGVEAIVLRRVAGNAEQLARILERPPVSSALRDHERELPLRPHEVLTVRKAWEVGVRPVVMQTIVQLDGDVLVRTQEVEDPERHECLVRFHHATLGQGSACWLALFESAGLLGSGALRGMFLSLDPSPARRPGGGPDPSRHGAAGHMRDLRALLLPLVVEGGASIVTNTSAGVAARTVIQPDGDLVCFVSSAAVTDEAAHHAHASAVAAWCARLAASLRAATTALRAATPVVALAVAVAWSAAARSLWSLFAVAGTLVVSGLGTAVARVGGRARTGGPGAVARDRMSWLLRALLAAWGVALLAVGWWTGRLVLTVGPVALGLGLSVLAQHLLRKVLGLDAGRRR